MTKTKSTYLALLAVLLSPMAANADFIGVDWQSTTVSTAAGDLNGISVEFANLSFPNIRNVDDLSGPNFSAAPLSSPQEDIGHGHNDLWTATFDQSITDLLLYGYFWRGPSQGAPDPATFSYTFDSSFSILSGFNNATISGNTLILPTSSYHFGILQFSGSLSSLSLTSTNATSGNQQATTFGLDTASQSVPEPGSLALLGLGLVGMAATRRRRKV